MIARLFFVLVLSVFCSAAAIAPRQSATACDASVFCPLSDGNGRTLTAASYVDNDTVQCSYGAATCDYTIASSSGVFTSTLAPGGDHDGGECAPSTSTLATCSHSFKKRSTVVATPRRSEQKPRRNLKAEGRKASNLLA